MDGARRDGLVAEEEDLPDVIDAHEVEVAHHELAPVQRHALRHLPAIGEHAARLALHQRQLVLPHVRQAEERVETTAQHSRSTSTSVSIRVTLTVISYKYPNM